MLTFLRKYGEATTITFGLRDSDGVLLKSDAVYATGDIKIMKDEAVEANTTNGFVDEGQGYSLTFTAAEITAKRIQGYIEDQGSPVWLGREFVVETYGHANAQHPNIGIVMRGTDSAALASIATEARLAELDAGNLPLDIAALPTVAEIWSYVTRSLTDKLGFFISGTKTTLDDLNDLSLGDIQGEIQSGVLAKRISITGDPFSVVEGNVKTFVITLGPEWDLTDKLVYFVMSKQNSSDSPIVNRLVDRITDAVNGIAEIDLLDTETTPQGCYDYQVELRNDPADDEPETAMEGTAEITENLRS